MSTKGTVFFTNGLRGADAAPGRENCSLMFGKMILYPLKAASALVLISLLTTLLFLPMQVRADAIESSNYLIAAGHLHTCALDDNGVSCWGYNPFGQTDVAGTLGKVTQLAAGAWHTCALDETGVVTCWGHNGHGQTDVPSTLGTVTQLAVGLLHTCALDETGVSCWGYDSYGVSDVPSTLGTVTQLATGDSHVCALDEVGVTCWGNNGNDRTNVPSTLGTVTQLAASSHTCALDEAGITCWGYNYYGQTDVPSTLGTVTELAVGSLHTCALDETGVSCWGRNKYGETNVPSSLGKVTQLAAGTFHTCALGETGVSCWGNNDYGQSEVPKSLRFDRLKDADADGLLDSADNCPADYNPAQGDMDGDGLGDVCDPDNDNDGVLDADDQCSTSELDPTVVINECNTGVSNALFATGCTIADHINKITEGASSYGEFLSNVSHLTNDLKQQGAITGEDKGRIMRCAAQTGLGKQSDKDKKLYTSSR